MADRAVKVVAVRRHYGYGCPPEIEGASSAGQVVTRRTDRRDSSVVKPGARWEAEFVADTSTKRVVDISDKVRQFARGVGESGLVNVFVPHATAGLALMETGAGSEADLGEVLDRLFPSDDRYAHQHGSKGHGRSHIIHAFISPSMSIPCDRGNLLLGQWQSLVLVDANEDNVERKVLLSYMPGRG